MSGLTFTIIQGPIIGRFNIYARPHSRATLCQKVYVSGGETFIVANGRMFGVGYRHSGHSYLNEDSSRAESLLTIARSLDLVPADKFRQLEIRWAERRANREREEAIDNIIRGYKALGQPVPVETRKLTRKLLGVKRARYVLKS